MKNCEARAPLNPRKKTATKALLNPRAHLNPRKKGAARRRLRLGPEVGDIRYMGLGARESAKGVNPRLGPPKPAKEGCG